MEGVDWWYGGFIDVDCVDLFGFDQCDLQLVMELVCQCVVGQLFCCIVIGNDYFVDVFCRCVLGI